MARLNSKQRQALPKGSFAIPAKAPASGSYPIEDRSHAQNALARVSQFGSPAEKKKVRSAVASRYPGMGRSKRRKSG